MRSLHHLQKGFTIVEMLIVAPIVLLTIGAFITVVVNMTGDVLASRSSGVLIYSIQDALDRIESDVKLSTTFLAQSNVTLNSPQGFNNDTTAFNNVDSTNGDMLILNTLATSTNPISTTSSLIYLVNQPNGCTSTQVSQNKPLTMNVIYFVKNNTLWRRSVMPSDYTTAGCSVPWQQPSCNPAYMTANPGAPIAFCKTQDIDLLDNISPSDFSIQYFTTAAGTTANTVASDTTQSVATRNSSLQSSTTIEASITVNTTAAGRNISQSGSIRATKLDTNASTIAPVVAPTTPSAPSVTASLTQPTSAVFTWSMVAGATGYTIDYNINGGAWTNGFTNQNTTTFTPPSCATSTSPCTGNSNVVNVRVNATNSAGTSPYGTLAFTIPLWDTPVLQNGWTDYNGGWTTAGFTKTSSGLVVVKGLVDGGPAGVIANLPIGYRPAEHLVFLTSTDPNAAGRADVYPDGDITMSAGSGVWFSLDNIRFMPSGTSFTAPTLNNGWVNYNNGYPTAGYMIDPSGRVQVKGLVQSGAIGNIFSLPTNATPAESSYVGITTSTGFGEISIQSAANGQDVYYVTTAAGNAYADIQTMYYPASYSNWTNLTLQNSWVYYGSPFTVPAYTKGSDNVVTVKGFVKAGAVATVIATLPVGDRPAQTVMFANAAWDAYARIDVQPNGNIVAVSFANNGWLSIDNINFMAEQ